MPLKTFIVEDNVTIRTNLSETLAEVVDAETVGYAEREDDAITWLTGPDEWSLAIVDLFLAQGSGLGVLMAIATRPPSRKVVVLSNYATAEIRQRCKALGADAVFDKSSELENLFEYCLSHSEGDRAG